jgi:hypothetical protein
VYTDGLFAVMVDGVLQATFSVAADAVPHYVSVTGLTIAPGGSTVEVWEPWCGKAGTQNTGADAPVEAGYVTGVYLPPGPTFTAPTCTTGIIAIGDSIIGARLPAAATPMCLAGVDGQLRVAAEAAGQLYASLDYGGACMLGDGLDAADFVQWINETRVAMGNPTTVKILWAGFHNDYADNGSSVSTTPTDGQNLLQDVVDALGTTGVQHFIVTTWPASSEGAVNGFTLPNWRTKQALVTGSNVTILDSTAMGINTATDLQDGVHFNDAGVALVAPILVTALGL